MATLPRHEARNASTTSSSKSRSSAPVRSPARWSTPTLNRRAGREPIRVPASLPRAHPQAHARRTRSSKSSCCAWRWTAAGFSGGEAEELRRAMGFKRSVERMQRASKSACAKGMPRSAASSAKPRRRSCAASRRSRSTAFPESHAASFALDRLRVRLPEVPPPGRLPGGPAERLADGLLQLPATLVKDAQRHDVEVRAIDVARSDWRCDPGERGQRPRAQRAEAERSHNRKRGQRPRAQRRRAPWARWERSRR